MKFELSLHPSNQDLDFLTAMINKETPEYGEAFGFAFFGREEEGNVIAGCNGSVVYGCIYTDMLWVHPLHRKKGLGRKLMDKVHAYGKEQGCTMATVATMTFQGAVVFYEQLGYRVDFEQKGYIQDSSCLFMRKSI
jgi:GNAT superfamily N-acetyltransferase